MAYIDWRIRGPSILSCNCAWGCPCQFNSLPTEGHCRAVMAQQIEEGHFGEVDLSGTRYAVLVAWPGAIHFGNGEALPIIDESASDAQRQALLTILSGGETEPGATIFNVFAPTYATVHEPQFHPIEMDWDDQRRVARLTIAGIVETSVEPIRNPVTGEEHRARVVLPHGFEYREAEYASGSTRASGPPISLDYQDRHAHLAMLDLSTHGAA
jgi:hypothetical protein